MPLTGRKLKLRLYVAGNAANSLMAISNLHAICDENFSAVHVEIVDLLKHPSKGLDDGVIVTPTLVKLAPSPVRKITGNLSDTGKVVLALAGK